MLAFDAEKRKDKANFSAIGGSEYRANSKDISKVIDSRGS